MKRYLIALLLILGSVSVSLAQNPVTTNPSKRNAASSGSIIAVTNTFQTIFAANANRFGCIVQNNGSNNMRINVVAKATATLSNSAIVAPGAIAKCTVDGTVLTGEISITGTVGDGYYASQY